MSPTPGTNRENPNAHEQNDTDSVDSPQFIIAAGSSDEGDSDDNANNGGYQMLPQEPETLSSDEEAEEETEGAVGVATDCSVPDYDQVGLGYDFKVPDIDCSEATERREVWQSKTVSEEPLNPDQVDKIKLAMRNINLSQMHIPEWAKVIDEEHWKDTLLTRLHGNKTPNKNEQPSKEKRNSCERTHSS